MGNLGRDRIAEGLECHANNVIPTLQVVGNH